MFYREEKVRKNTAQRSAAKALSMLLIVISMCALPLGTAAGYEINTVSYDPQHSGQSNYSTASNYGSLVWTFVAENSGVSILDNWFFKRPLVMGANDTILFTDNGTLYGIKKGELAWQYQVVDRSEVGSLGLSPPFVSDNGTIYIGGHDGYLHALDPDGQLLWKYNASAFIDSTPVVGRNGTVYVATTLGSSDGEAGERYYLHAVNPNGTLQWMVETGPCDDSALVLSPNGTVYLVSGSKLEGWGDPAHYLYSIAPNGTVNWVHPLGDMSFLPPAVGNDGTVYLLTDEDLDGDESVLVTVRQDGSEGWRLDVRSVEPDYDGFYGTSPAVASNGTSYFGFGDGICAVGPNGTVKWIYNIENGMVSTPAISKEGTIIFGTIGEYEDDQGNYGYVVALNPDGSLKWRVRTTAEPLSSVAIGTDGTIYIAAGGEVYALNGGVSSDVRAILSVGVALTMTVVLVASAMTFYLGWKRRKRGSDL